MSVEHSRSVEPVIGSDRKNHAPASQCEVLASTAKRVIQNPQPFDHTRLRIDVHLIFQGA